MKMMTAMLHEHSQPQPNKPEQQMMGDMTMPSSAPMPAGSM
jgi:hypothetical protein